MRMSFYRYSTTRGLQRIKTKTALILSAAGLVLGGGIAMTVAEFGSASADGSTINFERPAYSIGNIDGQNGWSATGSAGHGCATYDEGVAANTFGFPSFGKQTFRISDAVTSGCFGDQAFAPALSKPAGEPNALDKSGNPVASPLPHFVAKFDIASATKAMQPDMSLSVSPDNGVGARMSYLRFVDQSDGIHVFFDDATDPSHVENADQFNESDIATLSYKAPHHIVFSMDFHAGPDNDVVRIYIDGKLAKVGTSWEDYYLYDTESNPGLAKENSRVVDTLLFREAGTPNPANAGKGYLIDNLSYRSGKLPNGGSSKNKQHKHSLTATGKVTLSGPTQKLNFTATDNGPSSADTGTVHYQNPGASLAYDAPLTCVNVFGNTAYFAYVIPAGNPYTGTWVVWKVTNGSPDTAGFTTASDQNSANALCESGSAAVTNYPITAGNIDVE